MLLPLHGAAGGWDEIVCLLIPLTLITAVALGVLREQDGKDDAGAADDDAAGPMPDAGDGTPPVAPRERTGQDDAATAP